MATPTNDSVAVAAGIRTVRLGKPGEPAPNDPGSPWLAQSALSITLPSAKTVTQLGTATVQSLAPGDATAQYWLRRMIGAWPSFPIIKLYNSSGQLVDVQYIYHGGGHSDSGYSGTAYWSLRTRQWYTAQATLSYAPVLPPTDSTLLAWGEDATLRPGSAHPYQHNFTIHSNEAGGPAFHRAYAGGLWATAASVNASHKMPWVTKTWERVAQLANSGVTVNMVIKDRLRSRAVRWPVPDNRREYFVHDYLAGTVVSLNQTNFRGPWGWSDTNPPCGVHHEAADLYIAAQFKSPANKLMALNPADLASNWVTLSTTGASIPANSAVGINYRSATGTLLMVDSSTIPPTGLFEITPPVSSPLTNPWTVVRHSFTGGSALSQTPGSDPAQILDRFQYVSELDALIVCPSDSAPVELWKM
jgi:hypothetical protein